MHSSRGEIIHETQSLSSVYSSYQLGNHTHRLRSLIPPGSRWDKFTICCRSVRFGPYGSVGLSDHQLPACQLMDGCSVERLYLLSLPCKLRHGPTSVRIPISAERSPSCDDRPRGWGESSRASVLVTIACMYVYIECRATGGTLTPRFVSLSSACGCDLGDNQKLLI